MAAASLQRRIYCVIRPCEPTYACLALPVCDLFCQIRRICVSYRCTYLSYELEVWAASHRVCNKEPVEAGYLLPAYNGLQTHPGSDTIQIWIPDPCHQRVVHEKETARALAGRARILRVQKL